MKRENQKQVNLMMWETDPKLRNKNNVIKFYIPDSENIEIGDEIYQRSGDRYSVFEITEINEVRPGSVSGMNYVTAKTYWSLKAQI